MSGLFAYTAVSKPGMIVPIWKNIFNINAVHANPIIEMANFDCSFIWCQKNGSSLKNQNKVIIINAQPIIAKTRKTSLLGCQSTERKNEGKMEAQRNTANQYKPR